jgi:hypothetical protein
MEIERDHLGVMRDEIYERPFPRRVEDWKTASWGRMYCNRNYERELGMEKTDAEPRGVHENGGARSLSPPFSQTWNSDWKPERL